jgi:methylenetetrahydrofolate dehydrogenase (NADP+)/methenyltetrahydrofolate cyclohydrolase
MITFNGKQFAAEKEVQLQPKVVALKEKGIQPHVGCLVFFEDEGGLVYSQEKKHVAKRLGIEYGIVQTSLSQDLESTQKIVQNFAESPDITGIIIQKPWRKNWEVFFPDEPHPTQAFQTWWHALTRLIPLQKDIDGLNPDTLQSIKVGNWRGKKLVLPATCRAVLTILELVQKELPRNLENQKTLIVGRSELLGSPLYFELKNRKWKSVQLVGQNEFQKLANSDTKLTEFSTIISSTGVDNLITGEMVRPDCVIIDAGFPQGDVDFDSVSPKASFITPVPNGVGPVTVISLLENVVELCYNFSLNK